MSGVIRVKRPFDYHYEMQGTPPEPVLVVEGETYKGCWLEFAERKNFPMLPDERIHLYMQRFLSARKQLGSTIIAEVKQPSPQQESCGDKKND